MKSEDEYNQLIDHITCFVKTEELPSENFKKFKHIHNINNDEIRYTFYVLWNETNKKIDRKNLCKFIILSFEDFSTTQETTLYRKLHERPSFYNNYVPDSIKNYDLNK